MNDLISNTKYKLTNEERTHFELIIRFYMFG